MDRPGSLRTDCCTRCVRQRHGPRFSDGHAPAVSPTVIRGGIVMTTISTPVIAGRIVGATPGTAAIIPRLSLPGCRAAQRHGARNGRQHSADVELRHPPARKPVTLVACQYESSICTLLGLPGLRAGVSSRRSAGPPTGLAPRRFAPRPSPVCVTAARCDRYQRRDFHLAFRRIRAPTKVPSARAVTTRSDALSPCKAFFQSSPIPKRFLHPRHESAARRVHHDALPDEGDRSADEVPAAGPAFSVIASPPSSRSSGRAAPNGQGVLQSPALHDASIVKAVDRDLVDSLEAAARWRIPRATPPDASRSRRSVQRPGRSRQ